MHRYFVENINHSLVELGPENFHHLKNVVKLKMDEQFVAIYNKKNYLCKIKTNKLEDPLSIEILSILEETTSSKVKITLVVGLIKEKKWDFLLQKISELGIFQIIPFEFKRNVVKIEFEKMSKKMVRWNKIIEDASEQSNHSMNPTLFAPLKNIAELINFKSDLNIVAYENDDYQNLKQVLGSDINSITIVIGPEGGFESDEIKKFKAMDFKIVNLGKKIFRTETAAIVSISSIFFNYEL